MPNAQIGLVLSIKKRFSNLLNNDIMGLFDFIKKENKKVDEPANPSEKAPYFGDLSKTAILNELFNISACLLYTSRQLLDLYFG